MQKTKTILTTVLLIFLNVFGLIAFLILFLRSKNKKSNISEKVNILTKR